MSESSVRGTRSRRLGPVLALAAWTGLAGGGALAAPVVLPTTGDQLVGTVRAALEQRDLAAFEELVNWDGASKMRRRVVSYQLRYGFGRPIRSISLEPFPVEEVEAMEAQGRFRANMPISEQVRVVFDEPDNQYGKPPTAVFLVGREGEAYRIALVVPTQRPRGD